MLSFLSQFSSLSLGFFWLASLGSLAFGQTANPALPKAAGASDFLVTQDALNSTAPIFVYAHPEVTVYQAPDKNSRSRKWAVTPGQALDIKETRLITSPSNPITLRQPVYISCVRDVYRLEAGRQIEFISVLPDQFTVVFEEKNEKKRCSFPIDRNFYQKSPSWLELNADSAWLLVESNQSFEEGWILWEKNRGTEVPVYGFSAQNMRPILLNPRAPKLLPDASDHVFQSLTAVFSYWSLDNAFVKSKDFWSGSYGGKVFIKLTPDYQSLTGYFLEKKKFQVASRSFERTCLIYFEGKKQAGSKATYLTSWWSNQDKRRGLGKLKANLRGKDTYLLFALENQPETCRGISFDVESKAYPFLKEIDFSYIAQVKTPKARIFQSPFVPSTPAYCLERGTPILALEDKAPYQKVSVEPSESVPFWLKQEDIQAFQDLTSFIQANQDATEGAYSRTDWRTACS